MATFAKNIHDNHLHLVLMLEAGLSAEDATNAYYKMALDQKVLI